MPDASDPNAVVAAALHDMATVQTVPQRRRAYTHAATAVLGWPERLTARADGTLAPIAHVGVSAARVILEVLAQGLSPTVERAIVAHGQQAAIARARELRVGFLSRAVANEVLAIAGAELRACYQGDLQMHSTWSDGRDSVRAMAEACLARGYRYAAMTDHAVGLPVAHGLSVDRLRAQGDEIAQLNHDLDGTFAVLAGVEANIGAGGDLDVTASDRASLALVAAAPHSGLRDAHTQTKRMLEVVATDGVHILGHPRGRKYGVRPGVSADWPRVFATAARHGVAIEIDGDPSRQDIDGSLATLAVEAGCLFALDSDAHSVDELWYADMALAHARLADIPADRIVNCWPLDRLRAWLAARARGRRE